MAGLFGGIFNYSKPGRGVQKDIPEKKSFFKFWEIFFRKFWQLISLNLIFLICLLPLAAISFFILSLLQASSWSVTENIQLAVIFTLSPFMLSGPFIGGCLRITRDYAREEPVFIWSDYIKAVKNNFKQTIFMSIIGYIIFSSLSVALPAYYNAESFISKYIIFGICLVCGIVFLFMQYFVYSMAVTFDLKLVQIYKNAAILSTIAFAANVSITFVLAIYAALIFIVFWFSSSFPFLFAVGILFFAIIGFAFLSFTVSYSTFPLFKKYIIDPYYQDKPEETSSALNLREDDNNSELSEYVYHNGKMVHRSVLEKESLFNDSQTFTPKDKK